MTAKIGISLPDSTYQRACALARAQGMSMSGLIDEALNAELTRRELTEHIQMLEQAESPQRLHERAHSRGEALAVWKSGG